MTTEEILNAAIVYSETEDNFFEYDDCGYVSDDKEFIEKAFAEGVKWANKIMIEKACEWLKQNAEDYVVTCYDKGELNDEDLLNDFKRAMEE